MLLVFYLFLEAERYWGSEQGLRLARLVLHHLSCP
jgi:hypothetical protein